MVVTIVVGRFYVEKSKLPLGDKGNSSTAPCVELEPFQQPLWRKFFRKLLHRLFFHIPQRLWIKFCEKFFVRDENTSPTMRYAP